MRVQEKKKLKLFLSQLAYNVPSIATVAELELQNLKLITNEQ